MKRTRFNWAGVVVLVVIVGFCIWWFAQSQLASPSSEKTLMAPTPAKIDTPRPAAPLKGGSSVAAPVAPPALKPATTSVADQASVAVPSVPDADDPQAKLETAITDIANLQRTGDLLAIYETYTIPDKLDPKMIQRLKALQQQTATDAPGDPKLQIQLQQIHDAAARSYEALETQTPTYNEAGDEATYMISFSELTNQSGSFPKTFIKINGKWYEKPEEAKGAVIFK